MERMLYVLLAAGALLALILILSLRTGKLYSTYDKIDRARNPGGYWAMFVVLLLPLVACLFLVATLSHHHPHP
jgi:hypothetical protein